MKSAEYWQKRSEQVLIDNEKLAIDYEKEMAKIYEETKLKTQTELEAFYQRYAKNNNLDLADVRQRLNPSELKNFRTQQKIYLDKVKELIEQGADLTKYNKTLEELSARAYVTKLQELQNNLNSEIMLLTGEQQIKLTDVLKTSYLDGYFKTMYTVQKGLGMGVSFTKPSNDDVLKILKTPWNGANYSTRVWNNKGKLTDWLNTDLPRHFASGESVQTMASDLSKKLDTNQYNAKRLVRTEVNHISNQCTMDAYENSNVVEQYQILATLDSRTSDICRDMDNKIFKLSEKKVAVTMPPFHVNCRTTTVPYFEEYQDEDLERIARDNEGNTYTVPANMSYEEWDKKYGQSSVKQEPRKQESQLKTDKQTNFEELSDNELKERLSKQDNADIANQIDTKYKNIQNDYNEALLNYQEMNAQLQGEWKVPEGVDWQEYNKLFMDKYNKAVNTINSFEQNKKNAVLDILRNGEETFKIGAIENDVTLVKQAQALQNDMKGILHKSLIPQNNINFKVTTDGRSFYNSGTLNLNNKIRITTSHHEFMHALEHYNPSLLQKSIRFLKYRTKGEKAKLLSKLTGNKNYKDYEVAKKDKFFSPYCGKEYKINTVKEIKWENGKPIIEHEEVWNASEILSMGFERLLTDGVNFYKQDPEYFNFVINAIKNKL